MSDVADDDRRAIELLVARQFASLSWPRGGAPDVGAFSADFLPTASLYASARPAQAQTVKHFAERMSSLAGGVLASFDEQVIGTRILVFGNVAVAAVACETIENEAESNRNVEMMLLVKDEGAWKIVAQAWDKATAERPIPPELLGVES